jgi:UDP:flavonoid glycosyltransferase YjiC (YdhE family)
MRKHLGNDVPSVNNVIRNASFVLINSHPSVSYPRAYLPNVAEVACLHCREARRLPEHLEKFIDSSGEAGFIYVSLGSSVKTSRTPRWFFDMLISVFSRMPLHVLWKFEHNGTDFFDLPPNVMTERWLPQQDILGHKKIRGFFTQGGLFSLLETVYHGVPIILTPIFFDQDANAAAAAYHGYGEVLQLAEITAEKVHTALSKIIFEPKYQKAAK